MTNRKRTTALLATATVAALGLTAISGGAAFADSYPTNGSRGPVYIYDGNTWPYELVESTEWNMPGVMMPHADSYSGDARDWFIGSADSTDPRLFVSLAGDEGDPSKWVAVGTAAFTPGTNDVLLPTLQLENLSDGPAAGNWVSIKETGGTFSAGLAFNKFNGNAVSDAGQHFTTITILPGGAWTWEAPVVETETAPVVTEHPVSTSKVVGEDATFTAAASGNPAPSVQWESSTNGTDWAPVSGATSATLTVPAVTIEQTATQYRAVFTNGINPAATTTAATLSVTLAPPTIPGTPATQVTVPAPAAGDTGITFQLPTSAYNDQTLAAWVQYNPTVQLPNVAVSPTGSVTIPFGSVPAGTTANYAVVDPATNDVVAWTQVVVPQGTNESNTQLEVDVLTSNKFALEGVNTSVNLGDVKRGATTTAVPLSPFTVTDDRAALPGWNLTAAVAPFLNGTDEIPASAFGLAPVQVGTAVSGVTLGAAQTAGSGTYNALFAEGAVNSSTGEVGTQFDANLTFAAPLSAKAGTYTSTLTLTLTSK